MTASVKVGGVWLEDFGAVGDVEDSTIWRTEGGWSGDYEASCTFAARPDFSAPWFRKGAAFEVVEDGVTTWSGFLGEPQQGDAWTLNAFGWGADAANFTSSDPAASNMNANVDAAVTRGLGFARYGNSLTGGSHRVGPPSMPVMLNEALDRVAKAQGKVWWVSRAEVSLRSEATAVDWVMAPDSAYLGTTDDELVTSLQGFYVSAVDANLNPTSWGTVTTSDAAAASKFRPHERAVDLTALGQMTSAEASSIIAARFAQVGARAGWTNGFEMTALNSGAASNDVPAPLAVRAGQRVRVPGVTDMRSGVTYLASVEVTLGKVRRLHAEQRAIVEPVGMVPRNFAGALAAAQAPTSNVEEF